MKLNNRGTLTRAAIVFLLLAVMVAPLSAQEGTTPGEFTLANSDPAVNSIVLWTTGGSPAATTSMTPQLEYNVKVTVTDYNTLADLSTLKVTVFYDADGAYAAGDQDCSAHTQTCAIITWTRDASPELAISPSSSTTWSLVSASSVVPTLTNSVGTFELHFKPGKVATETASGKWHIHAKADDGAAAGVPGSNTQQNLTMNWYAQIAVNTSSIKLGQCVPGDGLY